MRKLLNTLFITAENAYCSLENNNVVISIKDEKVKQIPLILLEQIVCFSYAGASPALLGECAKRNIGVTLFTPSGHFLCRISDKSHGNVFLRKEQYRISDDDTRCLPYVRNMILGKVYNERWNLDRTLRDNRLRIEPGKFENAIMMLKTGLDKIQNATDTDSIRGFEGDCAETYFRLFDDMILSQKDAFYFRSRSRRPPLDNVNALLSFFYTILASDCANALESVGLDAYVGFMHTDRPGRASLSLDLMEELRAPFVDRFVLSLINMRQITGDDFMKEPDGAVRMGDDARKRILKLWQERKQKEIVHPYLTEKIEWGLVPYVQALLLARCIRGDLDEYPPFLWK